MSRCCALIAATLIPLVSGGCVVDDIHREMQLANTHLAEVQDDLAALERTNAYLAEVTASLDRTNARLDRVQTNLDELQVSLGTLDSIDGSLAANAKHLAALRETIKRIDSTIPFLSLGHDDEEPEAGAESAVTAEPDGE